MAIRAIEQADMEELNLLAIEENHPMVCPTHVIKRNGNISGALGIGGCTPVQMFLSKKYENKLDILSIRRFIGSYCDSISNNNLIVQVGPTSPGFDILEKMGATYIGQGHYWYYES